MNEEVKIVVFKEVSTQGFVYKVDVLGKMLPERNFLTTNGIRKSDGGHCCFKGK